MAGTPGTFRFPEVLATPPAPPAGYALLYIKTDNVLYLQDSSAIEIALGSSSSITSLTGDVSAVGPGTATAIVNFVGGKSAADITQSVSDTQAATDLNISSTLVKRDSSGNFLAGTINGILIESHASRHLPNGSDALATAAPTDNLNANSTNYIGTDNSYSRSDHDHAIDTGSPVSIGSANLPGSAPELARADHQHNLIVSDGLQNIGGTVSPVYGSTALTVTEGNDNRLSTENVVMVKKNPGAGEFSSIAAALATITTNSVTNPFLILVGPGVYLEPSFTLKSYVTIAGTSNTGGTIIEPVDPTNDLITVNGAVSARLQQLAIQGVTGISTAAIRITSAAIPLILDFVTIANCTEGVVVIASSANSNCTMFNQRMSSGSTTEKFIRAQASGGFKAIIRVYGSLMTEDDGAAFQAAIYMTGTGARIDGNDLLIRSTTGVGSGIIVRDGSEFVSQTGSEVEGFDTNLFVENTGAAPLLRTTTVMFRSGVTWDINIEHPGTTGSIEAKVNTINKVFVNELAPIKLILTDPNPANTVGLFIKGDILQADRFDRRANLSLVARKATTLGQLSGGTITVVSGLQISVTAGQGFLNDPVDIYLKEINWSLSNFTLAPNATYFVYVDTNSVVQIAASLPSLETVISLGRVNTSTSSVRFIEDSEMHMAHYGNKTEVLLRDYIGAIFGSGVLISESISNARRLDGTGGTYSYGTDDFLVSADSEFTWEAFYKDGLGDFNSLTSQNTVDNVKYDDGSGVLANLTVGYYATHHLYVIGDSGNQAWFLMYSQGEYSTTGLAQAAASVLPIVPDYISGAVVRVAAIIVQEGQTNIVQVLDVRPRIGGATPSGSTVTDHGNLTGLLDDDHPQYLLVNGVRPMTGPLDMGTNAISGAGLINGVTVQTHASRHLPSGADPLTTAAPASNLDSTTANATGIANSLSRSDHSHAISTGIVITQLPDQSNSAGISANLALADHVHNIPSGIPVQIGTSNFVGAAASFALSDHVHSHGNQTTGSLHAAVTNVVNGFMLAADKVKLDASTSSNTPSTLVLRDGSGNFSAGTITANVIGNASGSAATITGNLTGDVTSSGMATTIAAGAVTDAKASLAVKPPVTVVATTNLALAGLSTIDGVAIALNSLVLLTAQTTPSQNGPWLASSGAWSRPTWYPSGGTTQAFQFITCFVRLGTLYQGTTWRQTAAGPITIDTTSTVWSITPLALNSSTVTGVLPNANTTGSSANSANTLALRDANGNIATGVIFPTTTKTANYTIAAGDGIIFCDTSGGAFSLTLPSPSASVGKWYRVIDTKGTFGTNNLTLVRNGSEKIEGLAASKVLQTNWGFFNITSDGTDWYVG